MLDGVVEKVRVVEENGVDGSFKGNSVVDEVVEEEVVE